MWPGSSRWAPGRGRGRQRGAGVSPSVPSAPSSRVAQRRHICCGAVVLSIPVGIPRPIVPTWAGQPTIAATSRYQAPRRMPRCRSQVLRPPSHYPGILGLVCFSDWAVTIYSLNFFFKEPKLSLRPSIPDTQPVKGLRGILAAPGAHATTLLPPGSCSQGIPGSPRVLEATVQLS